MPLSFLHFDTAFRTDQRDDPFNCTLILANPLRKLKKIYLKSCEIPLGFFNFRDSSEFSFTVSAFDRWTPIFYKDNHDNLVQPVIPPNAITLTSTPVAQNFYFSQASTPIRTVTTAQPFDTSTNISDPANLKWALDCFPMNYKIIVPTGNFTINSLIDYLNQEIQQLHLVMQSLHLNPNMPTAPFTISTLTLNDTGTFPVGFVRILCGLTNTQIQITSTNLLTNNMLGFATNQSNSPTNLDITATNLWGLYNDLAIYLYFPNIPHNNTHFGMQLLSFKIPMSAGYQAIAFNADSQNFSQYVEISDPNYILHSLQLVIYDTRGNPLTNQFNWHFTLGFET